MELLSPVNWNEYEMIDTGGLEKLERFGKYILARPEPQAVWKKALPESEWKNMPMPGTDAIKAMTLQKANPPIKETNCLKKFPGQWIITYSYKKMNLRFRLGLTSFGHIGVFPGAGGKLGVYL